MILPWPAPYTDDRTKTASELLETLGKVQTSATFAKIYSLKDEKGLLLVQCYTRVRDKHSENTHTYKRTTLCLCKRCFCLPSQQNIKRKIHIY